MHLTGSRAGPGTVRRSTFRRLVRWSRRLTRRSTSSSRRQSAGEVTAVALVLHGGRERSTEPVNAGQLAVRRMRPFARRPRGRGRPTTGLAVWSLRYRVRGWNGDERSPVGDAEWALDQVQERYGDVPVALVGHSMGGQGGRRRRRAPHTSWRSRPSRHGSPHGEPYAQVAGRDVLVVHGRLDTTTSPRGSLEWARRAATVTERIWRVELRWERHAMLWRAPPWHSLATGFSLAALGMGPLPLVLDAASGDRLQITV